MCNELYEQVRQVAQWSAEQFVQPLTAGVCGDLRRKAAQQALQGLRPVAFEKELVLELADHPLDDLSLASGPATVRLRPCPAVVVFGSRSDQRSVALQPAPLPLYPREPLVCQVAFVPVFGHERLAYGPLVASSGGHSEEGHHALRVHYQRHLEP